MQAMDELRQTIARLRAPGGCPWDQEQTHASLTRCLIDECSELLDTIDRLDMPHMREELGDVLIQVVFHAQLAEEAGHFNLADVAREVNEKLIRRHPHVFGDNKLETSEQVIVKWEQIKAQEKAAKGQPTEEPVFKPQPPRLPSLMLADFVWKVINKKQLPARDVVDVDAIVTQTETLSEQEIAKRLFELAAIARAKGLNAEDLLRQHTSKVMAHVEAQVGTRTAS